MTSLPWIATSHPFDCLLPSQSPSPLSHAPLHMPPPHVGVVMWLLEQTRPHAPQLAALALVLSSQPSLCLLLLQSEKPALQAPLHMPPAQLRVMLLLEQTVPHAPQLSTSVMGSTQ